MRWLAITINLFFLGCLFYMLYEKGFPSGGEQLLLICLALAAPISSLFALAFARNESWLGLYFKRKALEEKARINALEKS